MDKAGQCPKSGTRPERRGVADGKAQYNSGAIAVFLSFFLSFLFVYFFAFSEFSDMDNITPST